VATHPGRPRQCHYPDDILHPLAAQSATDRAHIDHDVNDSLSKIIIDYIFIYVRCEMRLEDIYYQDKCVVLFDAPATSSRSAHWKRESSEPHRLLLSPFSSSAKWIRKKGLQLSGEH